MNDNGLCKYYHTVCLLVNERNFPNDTIGRSLVALEKTRDCLFVNEKPGAMSKYVNMYSIQDLTSCCRHVMNDVSENSLVLVDELGKGTEPMAGSISVLRSSVSRVINAPRRASM